MTPSLDNTIRTASGAIDMVKQKLRETNLTMIDHANRFNTRPGVFPQELTRLYMDLGELCMRFNSMVTMFRAGVSTRDPEDLAQSLNEIEDIDMRHRVLDRKYQKFAKACLSA